MVYTMNPSLQVLAAFCMGCNLIQRTQVVDVLVAFDAVYELICHPQIT